MIVHVITGLQSGGAENALFRLLSHASDPSESRVVSLGDGGVFQGRLEALGVRVTCLGMSSTFPSPLKWWRLVRLLRLWDPQLVQTWMYHADLLGGLAAVVSGVPVCWGIRNSDLSRTRSKRSTRLVAWLCARVSRHVPARAISCSVRAGVIHQAIGYSVPFEIVPNGFDTVAWRPQPSLRADVRSALGLSESDFVFAHAARSDPQKDHANLALAFNRVHATQPKARLLLCGKALVRESNYFQNLPFTPVARAAVLALGPRDDLPELWQGADAFVLSSCYGEAFPNVVAEAMASGLPCVVTDVGDAAEIVGETGVVVPASDPKALAVAMLKLCHLPACERVRLGVMARQRVLDSFTMERMASGFRRVWDDVISKGDQSCVG